MMGESVNKRNRKRREIGFMNNKQSILTQALETLENTFLPSAAELSSRIRNIKEKVVGMSDEQFESNMSMATTSPAGEHPYPDQSVRFLLNEVFPEIEKNVQNTQNYEVISAVNEIRGILGTDDNLHTPT
ncbi:hypothetical protein ACKE5C_10175 [Aneurinibacillus thermoaerophilus]|uniref:Uncharacterized protein n=1 Tax=Aneurinibacillus thermoaerophilus TaxID=143495 RepID=A0ABX8Y6J0_ANETH|nr:hypothetical protein [Aneurinibacillus thermoaerophilus]QYY41298.1 hypothetical protein K3F53_10060 [Aneurinibacillus thermoaerophilus]